MKCPKCNNKLVMGKPQKYETLGEHVTNPNMYLAVAPPKRRALYCRTRFCTNNSRLVFWNGYGEVYTSFSIWQRVMMKFRYYKFKTIKVDDAIKDNK